MNLNVLQMLKDIREQQAHFAERMEQLRVVASAGGGMVQVVSDGTMRIVSLTIDPAVIRAGDLTMLQDLVVSAVNEARRLAAEASRAEVMKLTEQMGLPDMNEMSRLLGQ